MDAHLPDPPSPPRSVEALRELVVRIRRGEAQMSLGRKALDVVARLVERPEEVAVRSITELAASLGVNASTLSRLARTLGYAGFSDFQSVFRERVAGVHGHFYSRQGHRLIDAEEGADDYVGVVVQLARESIANVESFLAQIDAAELRKVARLMARARRVRMYGVRQIHAVTSLLSYGLSLVRPDVSLLDSPGQGIAEALAQLGKGDVLVVSSVKPYSRRVVDVARIAADAGVVVVALTDSRASPLAARAAHVFFIPHQSSFISNSIGAYVVFCEGLINLVAKVLGGKALRALERQEQFLEALAIEMR
ncbi:MurR/RpiR family transcriptional regulator [Denitromonas iodatirespirans]|uniref:MurR/RpiR family transcriptional regulator n=1 Tax=Denitromonas iodatirespirans TaxID=2795389 RepID=A0A944DC27_DENI1|nr:MurR/RpiR family transcriptional regulator [Denitromonas iodatirespirans]MBT0962286.1 MurR/RpiR family transcriptional regulator [Denitromonas iodatirespirans]